MTCDMATSTTLPASIESRPQDRLASELSTDFMLVLVMIGIVYRGVGKSGGGPPQSKTRRAARKCLKCAKRLGLRQSSGALWDTRTRRDLSTCTSILQRHLNRCNAIKAIPRDMTNASAFRHPSHVTRPTP